MYVLGTACLAISFLDGYPRLVLLSVLSVCSLVAMSPKCGRA